MVAIINSMQLSLVRSVTRRNNTDTIIVIELDVHGEQQHVF